MFVRSIEIKREDDFGYGSVSVEKPLIAKIKIEGRATETVVTLSEETSQRVLHIISEELAAAARATVEAMVADIFTIPALAPPLPKEVEDDKIPF